MQTTNNYNLILNRNNAVNCTSSSLQCKLKNAKAKLLKLSHLQKDRVTWGVAVGLRISIFLQVKQYLALYILQQRHGIH